MSWSTELVSRGEGRLHPDSDSGVPGLPATFADGVTNDATPSFTGIAEANSLVTVFIDGNPAGTAVAVPLDGDDALQPPNEPYDIDGNWRIESTLPLEDGVHDIRFQYEDPAGNRESHRFSDCR